jgi:hypothetical protein
MQMAVETNKQGKGVGNLVNELLSFCKSNGIKEVVCHPENAVPFI